MLKEKFTYLEEIKPEKGDGFYYVPADKLTEVCSYLKETGFTCLSCLTGSDRGEFLESVYHIFSYDKKETVVLKVKADRSSLQVPSVAGIYASANWMEREAFDLLGIDFVGHPDLRRIMLPDDWVGYPLRKDYKEPEEYRGMSTKR